MYIKSFDWLCLIVLSYDYDQIQMYVIDFKILYAQNILDGFVNIFLED